MTTAAKPEIRWDPALLGADIDELSAAWASSLHAFAKRLPPDAAARLLMGIDSAIYSAHGETACAAGGGLHPKHRLTTYHDFFVGRIGAGERVIDLGSGVGALAASIASRCRARVTGIEWKAANIERARAACAGLDASFLHGDITTLRAPGCFDAVVLSNVLEHIEARPQRLKLWREWYAPSRFLIRVPAFDRDWRVPWKKELGVEWRLDLTHEIEYTADSLGAELAQAGLTITHTTARWGEYWVEAR